MHARRITTLTALFTALFIGLLIVGVGISCAKTKRPWIEGGDRLGTIHLVKDGVGKFYEYRDTRRRLIRRERHLKNRDLDTSFAIENYAYDEAGHETTLSFTDHHGNSTLGPPGFATRKTDRRTGEGGWLIDHRHFDSNDAPMFIPGGYHREEVQIDAENRLKRRRFYDDHDKPVGVALEHASDIVEVQYKRLMGTTPILYETFINTEGRPTLKRRLSGSTSSVRTSHHHHNRGHHRYHY